MCRAHSKSKHDIKGVKEQATSLLWLEQDAYGGDQARETTRAWWGLLDRT